MDRDMAGFFESKGLPYEATNMSQMLSAFSTSNEVCVVAQVRDGNKFRFFYGYHNPIAATNKAADIRRVRKYSVYDVERIARGSLLDIRAAMR